MDWHIEYTDEYFWSAVRDDDVTVYAETYKELEELMYEADQELARDLHVLDS